MAVMVRAAGPIRYRVRFSRPGRGIEKCQTDGSAPWARDAANSSDSCFSVARCRADPLQPDAADELNGKATARSLARLHDCMGLHLSSGLPIRCAERMFGAHCTRNQHHLLLPCVPPRAFYARAMVFSVRADGPIVLFGWP